MENELVKNMIKRENLVPGWNQKGTRLEKLDWPQSQTVKKDFLEKVPGHPLKGTGQLHKKIRYLISILSLTAEPFSQF